MEELKLQIILITGCFCFLFLILFLLKKHKLEVKYAIIWLAFSITMTLFACFPYIVFVLGDITRVINPVNFIFLIQIIFILFILLSVSAVVSGFSKKIKQLAQTNAILEKRVRELEHKFKGE